MKINENTILRIKVPAHLYESVKAQLTLNEAKGKLNLGAGMEEVNEKKTGEGSKKSAAKKPAPPKEKEKAEAPKNKGKAPHDGMKKAKAPEKKERSLDELKKVYEMLGQRISEMEADRPPFDPYAPYPGDLRYGGLGGPGRGGKVTDEPGEAEYSRQSNLKKNWKSMTPQERAAAMKSKPTTEPGGEKFDEPVKGDKPVYGPEDK